MAEKEIIKIIPQGFEALGRMAAAEIAKGNDMRPLMVQIKGAMADAVEKNFAAEGRPNRWQDLAPSTKKARAKRGKWPGQILQDSGQMAVSIQQSQGSSNTAAWVGTNKVQAAIQNFGGEIDRKPFSGSVRLRTDARGELMRQGKNENLSIFAAKRHKRAVSRSFVSNGFMIRIPAREFLKLTSGDLSQILFGAQGYFLKTSGA